MINATHDQTNVGALIDLLMTEGHTINRSLKVQGWIAIFNCKLQKNDQGKDSPQDINARKEHIISAYALWSKYPLLQACLLKAIYCHYWIYKYGLRVDGRDMSMEDFQIEIMEGLSE